MFIIFIIPIMRVLIQSRLHDYESVILKSRRKDNVYGLAETR